jgi:hypothetical protein
MKNPAMIRTALMSTMNGVPGLTSHVSRLLVISARRAQMAGIPNRKYHTIYELMRISLIRHRVRSPPAIGVVFRSPARGFFIIYLSIVGRRLINLPKGYVVLITPGSPGKRMRR